MTIKRRTFLSAMAGSFLGGSCLARAAHRSPSHSKSDQPLLGNARNLIFILLRGGPSHVDMWDLKSFPESPAALGPEMLGGYLNWPSGIMPKLAQRSHQFSLVRSLTAVELVHQRAVYHLRTATRPLPDMDPQTPYIPSMISHHLKGLREPSKNHPFSINFGPNTQAGYLGIDHMGLSLDHTGRINNLKHDFDASEARFKLFHDLMALKTYPKDLRNDHRHLQDQAYHLMTDPALDEVLGDGFDFNSGFDINDFFVYQAELAARAIKMNRGTQVIHLDYFDWDHHANIYQSDVLGHIPKSRALDDGLAHLLDELSASPGVAGGQSLLDETLIVAMGEFGRTVYGLNSDFGRDHWPYAFTGFFAGGGVQGGRVIGATDNIGAFITDRGWSQDRDMTIHDVIATIYGAMGIDWNQPVIDPSSGRIFSMIDTNNTGPAYAIDSLFV